MRSRVTLALVYSLLASVWAFACSDDDAGDEAQPAGGSAGSSTAGKGGSAGRGGSAGQAGGAGVGGRSSTGGRAGQAGEAGAGAGGVDNAGNGGTAGEGGSEAGTAGQPSADGGTAGQTTSDAGAAGESANGGNAGANGGGTSGAGANGGASGAAGEGGNCDPPLLVYLNRSGGTYTPGADDSRANKSSVISQVTTTPELAIDADDWDTVVSCITQKFAPFDVQVVAADPGSEAHIEVVFLSGGAESFLGSAPSLAPFNCIPIANAVVFVAGSVATSSPLDACGASASAVGAALGLESVTECPDAMAFSTSCPGAPFVDEARPCGTSAPTSCICHSQSTTQNSYAYLASRLGFACH